MAAQDNRRQHAREVVREIVRSHGGLDEELWAQLNPELRTKFEEAFKKKDEMSGSTIITLAKNLYSSEARFVFELIQNAEDNDYKKVEQKGEVPFISFKVYPGRIIIDSNEDGFAEANVRALCNIGKSSKTGAQGYIGEKGIGFKSVFMVASKAYIQSGPYSFYFKHNKGDMGIGMVNPVWEERPDGELDDPLTRITLTLHDSSEPSELATQRETIIEQFEDLPETLLLFLKKLKRIGVAIYNNEGTVSSSTTYSSRCDGKSHRTTLTKTRLQNGTLTEDTKRYHVIKRQVYGLAKSENRTYTDEEERLKTYATAEVALAFPIGVDSTPIIEHQDVFAFLPIRDFGFSFLIQSDFVTQASRQDIIETSARNLGLLQGITDTFRHAVEEFCKDKKLQYVWMRYLPKKLPSGTFWTKLLPKIKDCLADTKVLHTRHSGDLQLVKNVRRLGYDFADRNGDPLFEDLPQEAYLGDGYDPEDMDLLSDFGLRAMDMRDALVRVLADLGRPTSRMKDPNTGEDWHSRAAKFLSTPFEKDWFDRQLDVQAMPLIPLKNGKWTTVKDGKVHYSDTNGILIPEDLGLRLLDSTAARNPDRKNLFDNLGVTFASSTDIRNLIFQRYNENHEMSSRKINLQDSIAHLRYLYCTHETGASKCPGLCVYDHKSIPIRPSSYDVYLSTNEQYSAYELLKKITDNKGQVEAPGYEVSFLHPAYLESTPPETSRSSAFELWLQTYIGVRKRIPLISQGLLGERFTPAFNYVISNRPEMVLGTLKFCWGQTGKAITPSAEKLLCNMEVLYEGSGKIELHKTYLPVSGLKERCTKFLTGCEKFPFLQLPELLKGESQQDWAFLTKLGVGTSENLEFYLRVLDCILGANKLASSVLDPLRIFQLYEAIQSQCWGSEEKENQANIVRRYFHERRAIYVPSRGHIEAVWAYPKDCLWKAPADFESKNPMESLCKERIIRSNANAAVLNQFFQETLEIRNIEWGDFFPEFTNMRVSGKGDLSRIREWYRQLDEIRTSITDTEAHEIRDKFTNSAYIYTDKKAMWHTASDCLWTSAAEITGKAIISDQYKDLEDFFVNFLNVAAPSISMLADQLMELGRVAASPDKVEIVIWAINSMLTSEGSSSASDALKDAKVIPVMLANGLIKLRSSRENFSIIDRQKFADAFKGKAVTLVFNLTQVRNLRPFLKWFGLEKRYLSRAVTEVSRFAGLPGALISNQDRKLSCKAHALFRCAVHFSSPRAQGNDLSLYWLLRHAEVYEADEISCNLNLLENDGMVTVTESDTSKSRLYIDENGTELRIYVPRDPRAQELCYLSTLPPKILDLIMTDPTTLQPTKIDSSAITIIGNVLNVSSFVVDDLLEEAGIIPYVVPADDYPAHRENSTIDINRHGRSSIHSSSSSTSTSRSASSTGYSSSEPRTATPSSELSGRFTPSPSGIRSSFVTRGASMTAHGALAPRPNVIPSVPVSTLSVLQPGIPETQPSLFSTLECNSQYERLLDKIITASKTAIFPSQGPYNMAPLREALPGITPSESPGSTEFPVAFGVRSLNQMEHDKKIGAAGELFVFEVLSQLIPKLPAFSQDNWESTIRKYVTVHNKYATMEPWKGMETADITYNDTEGIFTRFLREKGYLQPDIWENARPMYYLEVKTTTKDYDTRFFVSKAQYKRMNEIHNSGTSNAEKVYVIIRVFNLDKDNIDMRIYVGPAALEVEGKLSFTAEQWSVVPRRGNTDTVVS